MYLGLAKEIGARDDYIEKVGIKRVETVLVLKFGSAGIYAPDDLKLLVLQLIGELSEDCYCAQWMNHIEYELWALLEGETNELTRALWERRGDLTAVQELKQLSELTQSWAMWDDDAVDPHPVSLEKWRSLYQSYLSENGDA